MESYKIHNQNQKQQKTGKEKKVQWIENIYQNGRY